VTCRLAGYLFCKISITLIVGPPKLVMSQLAGPIDAGVLAPRWTRDGTPMTGSTA